MAKQNFPVIKSRINGLQIPLLPGQAGILHRFTNPENQLVISGVSEAGVTDTDEPLVIPSSVESEVATAPASKRGKSIPVPTASSHRETVL